MVEVGNKMQSQMRLDAAAGGGGRRPPPPGPLRQGVPAPLSRLQLLARPGRDPEGGRPAATSRLGLFSSNETKDDVSTANLKYLLVPYYLGEMTEQIAQEDRIPMLKASQGHLKEFISICEALELIPQDGLELPRQKQPDTAANKRAQRIARFHRQECAKIKLQEIEERKERRVRSLRAASISAPIEAGEEGWMGRKKERLG